MSKWSEFLSVLAEHGRLIFSTDVARKVASQLDIAPSYLPTLLKRLKEKGWIESLRPGLYAVSKGFRTSPLHEFEIAMHLTNPATISYRSALSYHGMTDQIPRTVYISTSSQGTIPRAQKGRSTLEIGGVTYQFIKIKNEHLFGIQDVWIGNTKVKITDPERSLLDSLIRPELCGGFEEAIHSFHLYRDKLNLEHLIDYALQLGGPVISRLGWVLESLGFQDIQLIPLLRHQPRSPTKLDPTRPFRGRRHPLWMVRENHESE